MPRHPRPTAAARTACRGAAALAVTLLIFFVMALVSVFVNRNLIFEQRIAANQYRSTMAFEAAEAGLHWAEAQLNANQRLDSACNPSTAATDDSFRERYLAFDAADGQLSPRTDTATGSPTPLQPTCVKGAIGWDCSCPPDGSAAALTAPAGIAPAPAFRLQFLASGKPGVIRLVSLGCSSLAVPCRADAPGRPAADATARVEVSLGLLGALRVAPAAALTTAGFVDAPTAAFAAVNTDPATGIAVHAGAGIVAPLAQLSGPAGAPSEAVEVAGDAALASLGADPLFASYFGIGKARWRNQPAVTRVVCSSDCAGAVVQALAERASSAMVWIDGDATLAGPVRFGTTARPVVIVVEGALQLQSEVDITGALYAGSIRWDGAGGLAGGSPIAAGVRGVAISEGSFRGTATPRFFYDPSVLTTLSGFAGSFVRVSGSWRDF